MDVEILARHLQYLETVAETQPFASLLKPGGGRTPTVKNLNVAKDYVRAHAETNWHPVRSYPMMPKEMGGVVDEKLVVHGTKNLRRV